MLQFIKDSIRELKHVVWPTKEETKNFFIIVLVILVLFWIYLFIANSIFTQAIISLREFFLPIK
jgi:preprotein translocase SecE subunit